MSVSWTKSDSCLKTDYHTKNIQRWQTPDYLLWWTRSATFTSVFPLQYFLYPPYWQKCHSRLVNTDHLPLQQCQTQVPSNPCPEWEKQQERNTKKVCLFNNHFSSSSAVASLTLCFSSSTTSVSHSIESVSMAESCELCTISWRNLASFSNWSSIFSL